MPGETLTKPYFVHESSYVDEPANIGKGTKIWHFCHVMAGSSIGEGCNIGQNVFVASGVTIGKNVKIQNNVSVYTGVTLEDDVFCGPSMVFTNVATPRSHVRRNDPEKDYLPTRVRRGASLGANCTIVCGNTVGEYAFVGAGSVVTRDVPPHAIVVGVPARIMGWACRCGARLAESAGAPEGPASTRRSAFVCPECGSGYRLEGDRLEETHG